MRNSDVGIASTWDVSLSGLRWLLLFTFITSALTGCDGNSLEWLADDSSKEARLEEAQIALDDREYGRAETILLGLQAEYPNDDTVAQYLSNALAGAAGLDTLNLLETIDQLDASGDIDMVGLVLGDTNGILTTDEIESKLSDLGRAKDALTDLGVAVLTDDQKVQLGLLSLNHAALVIAEVLADETGISEITLTADGIMQLFEEHTEELSELGDATDIANVLTILSEDIINVALSIEAIATIVGGVDGNDLSDSFTEFRDDIAGDDDVVTEEELEAFIQTISQ